LPSDLQLTINRLIELADGPEDALLTDEQALELIKDLKLGRSLSDLRHWLIKKGWRDPHDLTTLKGSIWTKNFEGSVQAQADQLLNKFEQLSFASDDNRLDLSALRTYTLDDHQTQEIDDAISLQCVDQYNWIWIHIADPARLIPVDSPLDLEARARATSLYLADGLRPMLPLSFAAEVLSLRAGRRCASLSVGVLLDESGCIADTRVSRTWIRPCYRLTYEDGDELIELAPPGDEDLSTLAILLKKRQFWRERQGALMLEQSEGRFQVKDDQPELHVVESSPARRLVSEAMILMGTVIAEFGKHQNLALPYRSQPPTQLPSATDLSQLIEGPVRHAAIKRCLSRGVLGTRPMAHFSLGLSAYVQASSPIRRYADLLAHRQVVAHLGGSVPLSEHDLMVQLDALEDPLRQAQQIQREDQRHWQKVWFLKNRHEQWPALFLRWLRPQDQIALVHVECLAMDLACKLNGLIDPSPGLALIMRVLFVDPLTDQIEFVAK
ncbi:ribonuclease catalytic domain-containing protein, partial [Prochlorococcus sp. MIT 0702]